MMYQKLRKWLYKIRGFHGLVLRLYVLLEMAGLVYTRIDH